jgi:hypothetical protein
MGRNPFDEAFSDDAKRTADAVQQILDYYRVPTQELPPKLTGLNDILEFLLRPSGIMRRTVELTGGWYKDGLGALLCVAEDGAVTALIPGKLSGYTYFDAKSGNLFIGEIINDEFNKGYIGFCNITQVKNEDENEEEELLNFNIQKIFYFDGLGANNKSFIHHDAFTPEFYSKIQDIMNNIFQADYNLKDQNESVLEYFSYLEGIESNEDYNTALENYNSFDNAEQCIENEFISNYDNYFQRYKKGQQKLGLAENEKFLEQPDTYEEFEKNAFQNNL